MRLVTYQRPGEARLGAVVGDRVVDLAALAQAKGQSLPSDMQGLIDAGPDAWSRARKLLDGLEQVLAILGEPPPADRHTEPWPHLGRDEVPKRIPHPRHVGRLLHINVRELVVAHRERPTAEGVELLAERPRPHGQ